MYMTIEDVQSEYVRLLKLAASCCGEDAWRYVYDACIEELKEFACAKFTPEEVILMEYNAQATFVK